MANKWSSLFSLLTTPVKNAPKRFLIENQLWFSFSNEEKRISATYEWKTEKVFFWGQRCRRIDSKSFVVESSRGCFDGVSRSAAFYKDGLICWFLNERQNSNDLSSKFNLCHNTRRKTKVFVVFYNLPYAAKFAEQKFQKSCSKVKVIWAHWAAQIWVAHSL